MADIIKLAKEGCKTTCLDIDIFLDILQPTLATSIIQLVATCLASLGVLIETIEADLTEPLIFGVKAFQSHIQFAFETFVFYLISIPIIAFLVIIFGLIRLRLNIIKHLTIIL